MRKARKRRLAKEPPNSEESAYRLEVHISFVADETHLLDVSALGNHQHLVDQLVPGGRLRLQVNKYPDHRCPVVKTAQRRSHGYGVRVKWMQALFTVTAWRREPAWESGFGISNLPPEPCVPAGAFINDEPTAVEGKRGSYSPLAALGTAGGVW